MQANQRRSLPLIEVAMHRIANLLVELVEAVRLGMNRLPHSAGAIGAILRFLHNEQNLVHGADLACPFWQPMQVLVLSLAITSLGGLHGVVAEALVDVYHRTDEVHTDLIGGTGAEDVSPELLAFLLRPGIVALVNRDDELGDCAQDLEELGFCGLHWQSLDARAQDE